MSMEMEYSEQQVIDNIRGITSDLNDLIRLAKTMGINCVVETNKTVVDPAGTRIDAVSFVIFKLL